jgi:hypothetical protein
MPEGQFCTRTDQDAGLHRLLQTRGQVWHWPAQQDGQVGDDELPAEQRGGPQQVLRLGGDGAEPVIQQGRQRRRQLFPGRPDASGTGLGPLGRQGVDQLTQVERIPGGLGGQLAQRILGRRAEHPPHQDGDVGFGKRPERDQGTAAAGQGRAHLLYLRPVRVRPAGRDQEQPQLIYRGGELVPDEQRRVVGPLQVVDDHHRRGRRAQLVRERHHNLDTGHRHVAVGEHAEPMAPQRSSGMRAARVGRTEPDPQAVLDHAQRQPLGELVGHPPPDVPAELAGSGQRLDDQG